MGDIKLQQINNDQMRVLIDDSKVKLNLFANKWGDLANRVPRANLLQTYDDLTSVLVSINPEIRCRKFAGLHGYECIENNPRPGYLNFEEFSGYNHNVQNTSYYANNHSNVVMSQNSNNQVVMQGANYVNNSNVVQQGNSNFMTAGGNYFNSGIVQQGSTHIITPGVNYINNDSNMVQGRTIKVMTSSQNPSIQNVQRFSEQ